MSTALWVLSGLGVLTAPAAFALGLQRRLNVAVERRPDAPLVIASLGPVFLLAGLATALLYLAFRLAEPYLGIRPVLPARLALPAGFAALAAWGLVWTLLGLLLWWVHARDLGRNLVEDQGNEEVLPLWRRWGGATSLAAPDRSYLEWAVWPIFAAAPLLGWAWLSLGDDSFRIRPSELAVASVLWTSWALHLILRGRVRLPAAAEEEAPVPETQANAWPEVLERLQAEPEPREERAAEPLLFAEADPRTSGILSPLVAELLPPPGKLTLMQRSVLTKLALQGFVHVDPPVALDQLALSEGVSEVLEDRSGQRVRHQVVLAPEGQGKTALILLAAANHALVHTRSTLVVVRNEVAATALAERFRRTLEPSLLRWNLRVRHPGAGLMNDLSQGILPDVVICGLRDLVVTVLDQPDTFAPFLRNVGLIVVDDVESFLGPVEAHSQLAFRRLLLRMSDSDPQLLVLGCDSMEETGPWAKTLCGIDAVVRTFSRPAREARETEAAEQAAAGVEVSEKVSAGDGLPRHRLYSLRDFGAPGLEDLAAACERLAVPWHYRLCGDGGRDLGRGPLPLREEPSHHVEAPEDACVVLLDGTWSEVRREWKRLVRAGVRFSRFRGPGGEPLRRAGEEAETIAFVTRTDPDVEAAFDSSFLESLPRPVLRPPTGLAVEPHLSADLVRHWTEVEDVLRVFGPAVAPLLARLAEEGLLLCEPRTDVADLASEYVERVYVRALARAVPSSLLPSKVGQVEAASRDAVQIRDRTHLTVLGVADRASAHFLYYPGRIFKDARGTFVVVGREGDILAEPLLTDDISSPRRRCRVSLLEKKGGSFLEPHRVLLGQHPFQLALKPVEVGVEHVATYRLGPVDREVRQRTLTDPATRERSLGHPLGTVALVLTPNTEEEPRLTLAGARLFAAILRALLPVIYRGAGESLLVAVDEDNLYLCDAESGGNGTTRAIYRDGIEPLLRLVQRMAGRVTSLDRLRALYDEWGDEDEIIAESRGEVGAENGEAARQNLMVWLDSRLL